MSLRQLHDEIALHQGRRAEEIRHLLGLKNMLDAGTSEGSPLTASPAKAVGSVEA